MNSIDPKALKKLAAACRKAGIKTYKCGDLEFTLTDEAPVSNYKASKPQVKQETSVAAEFQTDSLTEDALLFWSSSGEDTEPRNEQ